MNILLNIFIHLLLAIFGTASEEVDRKTAMESFDDLEIVTCPETILKPNC